MNKPILLTIVISEAIEADIIHIHSMEELVVKMRRTFGNSKKLSFIIMEQIYPVSEIKITLKFRIYKKLRIKKLFVQKIKARLWLVKRGYYNSTSME